MDGASDDWPIAKQLRNLFIYIKKKTKTNEIDGAQFKNYK